MFKNYDKRGSVLLMVVGLLVILGTLGGTFLLVSSLDARQARLLAGKGRAELIASGAVGQVVRMLGEDLHFDWENSSAPYTSMKGSQTQRYSHYSDYPHDDQDRHIHSVESPQHYSNILGETAIKVSVDSENGTPDAYLIPTKEFTDDGEEYHVAVKVQDLGAKLCLNTGGENYARGAMAHMSNVARTPAMIDLKSFLGRDYSGIHSERCGGSPKTLTAYDIECGRRLLSPIESRNYRPIAIADEIYLRWADSNRKTSFGRVFEELDPLSNDKKEMLTTINASRSITRSPTSKVISARFNLSEADALDSEGKESLYTQLVLIAGSDDGAGGGLVRSPPRYLTNTAFPGFYVAGAWIPTMGMNSYSSRAKRCQIPTMRAAWVFTELPQATYRVWVTWGKAPTAPPFPAAAAVPFIVYSGGGVSGFQYTGGTAQRTFSINQKNLPTTDIDGTKWYSLGSYVASGTLAIEIHGPQGVPPGEVQFAFADAVMIESISLDLGSGSKPAAHLTANTWAAMNEDTAENKQKCFPFRPAGKKYTVFGVRQQPYITEAFATYTTRTVSLGAEEGAVETIDENSWRWGAAVELMNYTDEDIDLSRYRIALGQFLTKDTVLHSFPAGSKIPKGAAAKGGRLTIYDFDSGDNTIKEADVFGATYNAATWKRVDGLNFDNGVIRIVQVANSKEDGTEYRVPIDHVTSAPNGDDILKYDMMTDAVKAEITPAQAGKSVNKTVSANIRRDDSAVRKRYAVAKYWKPETQPKEVETVGAIGARLPCAITADDHKLSSDNGVDEAKLPETKVKKGFRMKLPHGLLDGPGALSELYLAGPLIHHNNTNADDHTPSTTEAPEDLPGILAREFALAESRGRANSRVANDTPFSNGDLWNKYPRTRGGQPIAWPLLIPEIVETVPMDIHRGDSPGRVYGRLNVNTATKKALERLPWPTGVTPSAGAQAIISYRTAKDGFVTPGEIALAFTTIEDQDSGMDRDAIYSAISGSVSISSDLYAVNIKVQLGSNPAEQARAWYYLAIVDRGATVFSTDKPAVLLFAQVK